MQALTNDANNESTAAQRALKALQALQAQQALQALPALQPLHALKHCKHCKHFKDYKHCIMAINFNDPITIYANRGSVFTGSKNKKVFLSISTVDIFACSATQPGADLNQ